jgi:hypothetical protein
MGKSHDFVDGYERAEADWLANREFKNPYTEGTDSWAGYNEAVYDLTQK